MSQPERLKRLYEIVWDLSYGGRKQVSFEDILEELVKRDLEELVSLGLVEGVGDDRYRAMV